LGLLRYLKSVTIRCLFVVGVCFFGYGLFVNYSLQQKFQLNNPVIFEIFPGEGMGTVARRLKQKKLITTPIPLIIRARLFSFRQNIKAGTYEILITDTAESFLLKAIHGTTKKFSVTLKEGWSFADFVDELNDARYLIKNDRLEKIKIKILDSFLQELNIDALSYEGLFFPDTYFYESGDTQLTVLQMAAKKMINTLVLRWRERESGLPYKNMYEALTMASIIEKESAVALESYIISGVFLKRLASDMKLQADPTVIYGLGQEFKDKLTHSGLKKDTAYNTYTRKGLPVTPISSPGLISIKAALNPAKTNYLYFMAKGDGSHQFSTSLKEHNLAVERYRKKTHVE
jgi:UPF0755 protein